MVSRIYRWSNCSIRAVILFPRVTPVWFALLCAVESIVFFFNFFVWERKWHMEGGVRKVRKPQNRTKNNKKPQYRIKIYRNTETAGCRRQDLQSFYPLKIRPAMYADINSGPVHTYPDIFESATFSFRIRKYPRPHVMWSQRIHIEFARPHVFGFTPDSLRIDKIVPPGTGSSRSNPESSRTALLSYSFKLFLPACFVQ